MTKTKGKLTPKQKKFADKYLETGNGTEAVIQAGYNLGGKNGSKTPEQATEVASSIAHENLSKPDIVLYLDEHVQMAKNVITEIAQDKENKSSDRISAAKDILDRTVGKPKERIEQNTKQNIKIEIISYADDNPTV